jgi:hypothetical protein
MPAMSKNVCSTKLKRVRMKFVCSYMRFLQNFIKKIISSKGFKRTDTYTDMMMQKPYAMLSNEDRRLNIAIHN